MRAGHSLGGALATLAAHDLQAEFGFPHLHCYTFGAPRTGNHAFAAETSRLVPETWHIINDRAHLLASMAPVLGRLMILTPRDCVPQRILLPGLGSSGLRTRGDTSFATCNRLWATHHQKCTPHSQAISQISCAGARSGHRCIINVRGDILVRPFPLEQRLFLDLRGEPPWPMHLCRKLVHPATGDSGVLRAGGKLKQHLLMSYARAMVAICDAQFTAKCLKG